MTPRPIFVLTVVTCASACACSRPEGMAGLVRTSEGGERVVDLSATFDRAGTVGTFILLDDKTGALVRHDPLRAATRFPPASTFKIPNSLIALETGVADGPDFALRPGVVLRAQHGGRTRLGGLASRAAGHTRAGDLP